MSVYWATTCTTRTTRTSRWSWTAVCGAKRIVGRRATMVSPGLGLCCLLSKILLKVRSRSCRTCRRWKRCEGRVPVECCAIPIDHEGFRERHAVLLVSLPCRQAVVFWRVQAADPAQVNRFRTIPACPSFDPSVAHVVASFLTNDTSHQ